MKMVGNMKELGRKVKCMVNRLILIRKAKKQFRIGWMVKSKTSD
jgi:hypothetical protein